MKLFSNTYPHSKTAVITAYWVALLPIVSSLFATISYLITKSKGLLGMQSVQLYFFMVGIPFLFLIIDGYRIFLKEMKFNSVKSTIKNHPEIFFLLAFVVWGVIATLLQLLIFKESVASNTICDYYGVVEGTLAFVVYALILLMTFWIKDREEAKRILFVFSVSMVFTYLFSLIDPDGDIYFQEWRGSNWASVFLNSNHYGYVLTLACGLFSMGLIVSKVKWKKIVSALLMVISFFILFANDTFGCQLAVFGALVLIPIVLSWFKGKFSFKYLIPLGSFVLISFISMPIVKLYYSGFSAEKQIQHYYNGFFKQIGQLFEELFTIAEAPTSEVATSAGSNRWGLWLEALNEIISSPIIGTGNVLLRPHNEYLQFAQVWGLPSVILYLTAFVIIFVKAIKHRKKLSDFSICLLICVGAYLISAFFGNTMPHTTPFFLLFLGFLIRFMNEDINVSAGAENCPALHTAKQCFAGEQN